MVSHTALALPPALLDLTLLRVANTSTRSTIAGAARWQRVLGYRGLHQAVPLEAEPAPEFDLSTSNFTAAALLRRQRRLSSGGRYLAVRGGGTGTKASHPIEKLGQHVQALDEAIKSEELSVREFYYSEEELLAFYQDVLAVPVPARSDDKIAAEAVRNAVAKAEAEEDTRLLLEIQNRICATEPNFNVDAEKIPLHRRILARAHDIISRALAARIHTDPDAANKPFSVPIGVLTVREYEALVRTSMNANDYAAGEIALDIAKSAGLAFPEEALTKILKTYSTAGNVQAADKLLSNFLKETPNELQRHLHVQTHLNATPKDELPTSALKLLHHYEAQNACVSMQTYTTVIAALYSRPLAAARAYAWDLFSHMRYVAHPNPDGLLYTLMIRACASPISKAQSSEPEKALDLWTEMTVDRNIKPTLGSYNAVILACAKSGEKTYINEAFRLTKQMLDSHRDARGFSAFRPDRKTFCALLEGTKRSGDLARARWILAEIVRGGRATSSDPNSVDVDIDAEIMTHLFHTYAAYTPPFIRASTKIVPKNELGSVSVYPNANASEASIAHSLEQTTAENHSFISPTVKDDNEVPSFARIPPQSHAEVIREVKSLFMRILRDQEPVPNPPPLSSYSSPIPDKKFGHVELNPRLIGAYLSVFYKHASLEIAQKLFNTIFDELNVTRIPRLFVEALERCSNSRKGPEREIALRFSDEVWGQWTEMENSARKMGKPIPARMVERAHVARIRLLAILEHTTRAMDQLREFAAMYPPEVIKTSAPRSPLSSTKTSLVGERPLVRMTSVTEVPDDYVPPLVVFRDIEVLHHRLLVEERKKDIGFMTWLCKSYEWALRIRRNRAIKTNISKETSGITIQSHN